MCFFWSVPGVPGMPSVHSVLGVSFVPCVPCVPSVLAFIFRGISQEITKRISSNTVCALPYARLHFGSDFKCIEFCA